MKLKKIDPNNLTKGEVLARNRVNDYLVGCLCDSTIYGH